MSIIKISYNLLFQIVKISFAMASYVYIILGLIIPICCTALGSGCIYLFKNKISANLNHIFNGFGAGVMLAASFFGLLLPALESEVDYMPSILVVVIGFLLGIGLILLIDHILPHFHSSQNQEEGIKTSKVSKIKKMFLAIVIHNIPEGLSVGVTFGVGLANIANETQDVHTAMMAGLMIAIGIGIQNIPEGAAVSLPFKENGLTTNKSFLLGAMSGIVEPIAAVLGLLLAYNIELLMPWCLALAAGCMIYVIVEDLLPSSVSETPSNHFGIFAFIAGFLIMMVLEYTLS